MIQAWRVGRAPYADLSGGGARRHGGRWNSPGLPMVYLAEHPALAVLEVRVHLDLPSDLLPDDYVLMRVNLPDESPEEVAAMPPDPRSIGDGWLRSGRTAVLLVPSVIVPTATNLPLNPQHPRAADAQVSLTWRPASGAPSSSESAWTMRRLRRAGQTARALEGEAWPLTAARS